MDFHKLSTPALCAGGNILSGGEVWSNFTCGKNSMERGKLGRTIRRTVWQEHQVMKIPSLIPQLSPSDILFSAFFTAELFQRFIHLHYLFFLNSHPCLKSPQSVFQFLYYTETTLAEAANSMLANQRNVILSLYYLASQQYPEVSHSFFFFKFYFVV